MFSALNEAVFLSYWPQKVSTCPEEIASISDRYNCTKYFGASLLTFRNILDKVFLSTAHYQNCLQSNYWICGVFLHSFPMTLLTGWTVLFYLIKSIKHKLTYVTKVLHRTELHIGTKTIIMSFTHHFLISFKTQWGQSVGHSFQWHLLPEFLLFLG